MFAVNGPSGPTTRCERRRRSDAEVAAEEKRKEQEAQRMRDGFFRPAAGKKKAANADNEQADGVESERAVSADGDPPAQLSSGIFKGCRIVFNGRTGKVSSYFLAKLVAEHGGNVSSMQMIKPSRITHMVGSNLSASKADKVLKKLGKLKVVTADWILQSVKHNKRLPEFDFIVYKDDRAAATMQSAFAPTSASS